LYHDFNQDGFSEKVESTNKKEEKNITSPEIPDGHGKNLKKKPPLVKFHKKSKPKEVI